MRGQNQTKKKLNGKSYSPSSVKCEFVEILKILRKDNKVAFPKVSGNLKKICALKFMMLLE